MQGHVGSLLTRLVKPSSALGLGVPRIGWSSSTKRAAGWSGKSTILVQRPVAAYTQISSLQSAAVAHPLGWQRPFSPQCLRSGPRRRCPRGTAVLVVGSGCSALPHLCLHCSTRPFLSASAYSFSSVPPQVELSLARIHPLPLSLSHAFKDSS